jgi:hypothetical protein
VKHFRTAVHGQTTAHRHDARRRNYLLLPRQLRVVSHIRWRTRIAHQSSDQPVTRGPSPARTLRRGMAEAPDGILSFPALRPRVLTWSAHTEYGDCKLTREKIRDNVLGERPAASRKAADIHELSADRSQCLTAEAGGKAAAEQANLAGLVIGLVGELALLGVVELAELRQGAAQPDAAAGALDQAHRHKPPGLLAVPRLDDQVGDRLSGRVDDQAAHLAAVTIRAACPGPDREPRLSGHSRLPASCWTVARTCPASVRCGVWGHQGPDQVISAGFASSIAKPC